MRKVNSPPPYLSTSSVYGKVCMSCQPMIVLHTIIVTTPTSYNPLEKFLFAFLWHLRSNGLCEYDSAWLLHIKNCGKI